MAQESTQLHFHWSIKGSFITQLAREKFYEDLNPKYAIDLLMGSTVRPDLSEADRLAIAIAILDGRKELVGTYPGDDYDVRDVPEDERDPSRTVEALFERTRDKIKSLEATVRELNEKMCFIAENTSEDKLKVLDRRYADYCDGEGSIFGTERPAMEIPNPWGTPGLPEAPEDMLQSVTDRMKSQVDEPDYGWLFPDGTFHPVDWGEHQGWAYQWLLEHDPEHARDLPLHQAGDTLSTRHKAVLLHSPYQGMATVTSAGVGELTKKQKEFLFDYYVKRGKSDVASKLYQTD